MIKFLSCALAPAFVFLLLADAFMPCRVLAGQNIIIDGTVNHNVYGNGNAADNGSTPIPNDSASLVNSPDGNMVIINSDATVSGVVMGGRVERDADSATASGNTVKNGGAAGTIWGGYVRNYSGSAIAADNSVTSSGSVTGNIYGAYARSDSGTATATGNSIISDGDVTGNIYGAFARSVSDTATSTGNSVTISGNVTGNVHGAHARSGSDTATVTGNSVTISGDVTGYIYGALARSDSNTSTAIDNSVIISNDGKVASSIIGGSAASSSGTSTASGNNVTANGGTVTAFISGGNAFSTYGSATATGNSVNISGGNMTGNVYGGYANSSSGTATASGNSLTVSGGTIGGRVYGGFSFLDEATATGSATGNTVTISGKPVLTGSNICGGFVEGAGTVLDAFSGNTLNIWNYSGSSIVGVYNFEYYSFLFPISQSDPVLTVTGAAYLGDGTRSSTVTASTPGGSSPLQAGYSVTLIGGLIDPTSSFSQTNAQGLHGATLRYNWDLDASTNNALTATLNSVEASPRAKALSEGWISGMALVNQGADAAAGQGIGSAVKAAQGNTLAGFGSFSGGWSRYDTGSHVDVSSLSLLAGLSFGLDLTPGRLTLGAFFEYGNGSYDTHNSFSTAASVKGDGDMYYIGGGILGRMDFVNTGSGHFYAETTGRAGKVHNEYDSSDLRDAMNRKAEYDSSSAYYGLHLGTGYIWNITEAADLDLYGKYFWTRQEGDSVTLNTGDRVTFKDSDSHRLRLGSRFSYAVNEYISPYIGAAWEHEFDGKAKATTYGYAIDAPSLKGDTGIGELGLTLRPMKDSGFSMDLGVQGYTGVREGVTGRLQLKYEF